MPISSNFLSAERQDKHHSVPSFVDNDTRAILVQAIKACLVAADKPTSIRTGLRDIHFEIHGSQLFATATNGHIALTVEATVPHCDPCSFLVSGESARDFVRSKGYSALLPSYDEFPDVRQVIPTKFGPSDLDMNGNTPRVGFAGVYLAAMGKILTALKLNRGGIEGGVSMRHNGPLSPVLFETDFMPESGDIASIRGFSLVVMPIRLN
tara:strand:- start:70 stop:696 length:627 start_codon:yes stop_codon:yes gene_type:complete